MNMSECFQAPARTPNQLVTDSIRKLNRNNPNMSNNQRIAARTVEAHRIQLMMREQGIPEDKIAAYIRRYLS
jgi:hypothetical protein